MPPELDRILYSTDLSTESIDGLNFAIDYAVKREARLIVFHVINQRWTYFSKLIAIFLNEDHEQKIRQEKSIAALKLMKRQLVLLGKTKFKDHLKHISTAVYLVVHYGRIAEEIMEKANSWGCKLIILGPRRKRLLGRFFLPSISRKLINRTDMPVQIIKQ